MPKVPSWWPRRSGDARLRAAMAAARAAGDLEAEVEALPDDGLHAVTSRLRRAVPTGGRLAPDDVPRALAAAREATRRVLGIRPHDVQLAAAAALQAGALVEMRTGEGKTVAAAIAAYLASIEGAGVHVVTVNDYLARRDGESMGRLLKALGASVGIVVSGLNEDERRLAYAARVVYATNAEVGFDYLRDNMRTDFSPPLQGGRRVAIVNEVDSILVDEARTPLVISGPSPDEGHPYEVALAVVDALGEGDVEVDRDASGASLTPSGHAAAEGAARALGVLEDGEGLNSPERLGLLHAIHQALRARHLMARDRDYVVRDGAVVAVDQMTGRLSPGRRYGEGLHQALEAREGVEVRGESSTLASVTYQNLFRGYDRLCGMSGTVAGDAAEFSATYGLPVVVVPTHVPTGRVDALDAVYRSGHERDDAVVAAVIEAHEAMRPVLIGTSSVERSEEVARLLEAAGLRRLDVGSAAEGEEALAHAAAGVPSRRFCVLNARRHDREAEVVALAGLPGAVTVATNMAGRGTDIKLGGEGPDAAALGAAARAAGGLLVVGTERNDSRRVDDQLRGRAGRQGDPGGSRFFVSLHDPLVTTFAGDRLALVASSLEVLEGQAIEHPWVSRAVSGAQARLEASHAVVRRAVLEFDDVVERQRRAVFARREAIISGESLDAELDAYRRAEAAALVAALVPEGAHPAEWDVPSIEREVESRLGVSEPVGPWVALARDPSPQSLATHLGDLMAADHATRRATWGEAADRVERHLCLEVRDAAWRRHVADLDDLRRVVGWRAVAQRKPVDEFRYEAFGLFERMLAGVGPDLLARLRAVTVRVERSEAA